MTIEPITDLPGSANIDPDSIVGRAAAGAHDKVDQAAAKAQQGCAWVEEKCQEALDMPRDVIRDHPIAAVVTALTIGFIWGRLGGTRD